MKFRNRLAIMGMMVLFMFLLHNSYWWWGLDAHAPLWLGFMPFAYYYYVAYAFLACGVIYLTIKLVWPDPPPHLISSTQEEAKEDEGQGYHE